MNIIKFCIRKPITILMLVLATMLFGFVSLTKLKVKLLPNISYPMLTIRTKYDGVSPTEIENLVTKPIEEIIGTVNNVVKISSVSKIGYSDVYIDFLWKTDMDFSSLDIKEKLDMLTLPEDCEKPYILRYDPSLDPIMKYGIIYSKEKYNLKNLLDRVIKRRIERIPGVAYANLNGIMEPEIQVELDEISLKKYSIGINEITTALASNNINLTGGEIEDGKINYIIRTLNEFQNVKDIKECIIKKLGNTIIKIKDIAKVLKTHKKREKSVFLNKEKGIELEIFKTGDENSVNVAKQVRKEIKKIINKLGEDYKIDLIYDQSKFITQSINNVYFSGFLGAILAIFVLYLFLKNSKLTFIISLAIPTSIITTFNFMFFQDITLNMMSLGGLALGIGMMVDNGIVVIENIYRYLEMGKSPEESATKGTYEIFYAVFASTLTTICVFFPLAFVQGIAGQIFKDQALTITYSLVASLVVSLTFIPMLSSKFNFFKKKEEKKVSDEEFESYIENVKDRFGSFRFIVAFFTKWTVDIVLMFFKAIGLIFYPFFDLISRFFIYSMDKTKNFFVNFVTYALNNKKKVLTISIAIFISSLFLYKIIGVDLFPEIAQKEFYVNVKLPTGMPINESEKVFYEIQKDINNSFDVKKSFLTIGNTSSTGGNIQSEFGSNIAQYFIQISDKTDDVDEVINEVKTKLKKVPDITYNFSFIDIFTFSDPIEIEVSGTNLLKLKEYSDIIVEKISKVNGTYDIQTNLKNGNPEIILILDKIKLAENRLTIKSVSDILKDKVKGANPTKFNLNLEEKADITVKLPDLTQFNSLMNITLINDLKLKDIAKYEIKEGPSQINRRGQKRVVTIQSKIKNRDLNSVTKDIEKIMKTINFDSGYFYDISGQNKTLETSITSLKFALTLAIILVYMVLASLFESLVYPFIIMFSVPFAVIGVLISLYLTGSTITVVAYIGFIMLAGIVVNDAIVLVDFINHLREKEDYNRKDAIIEAVKLRFRPIMMTTLTTVLGLLPMALGFEAGAEIRTPMAITVIGGLISSTILTMVIIPVIYEIIDNFSYKFKDKK